MREYKRIFGDENVNEDGVEIKATKLINKSHAEDLYDSNDNEILFSDINNEAATDGLYGRYDVANRETHKSISEDYTPNFDSKDVEIDETLSDEVSVAQETVEDELDFVDSDAIRFNDISNSEQDAGKTKDTKEYLSDYKYNSDVEEKSDDYFLDDDISISKRDQNEPEKTETIHLLSELDNPNIDDSDVDQPAAGFYSDEDDEDVFFSDIDNTSFDSKYSDSADDLSYVEADDISDNRDDDSIPGLEDLNSSDEYFEDSSDIIFEDIDDSNSGEYEIDNDYEQVNNDLIDDYEDDYEDDDSTDIQNIIPETEEYDANLENDEYFYNADGVNDNIDDSEYYLDDLSLNDREHDIPLSNVDDEHDAVNAFKTDDKSLDNEDDLIENLDLANDNSEEDTFSSLDLDDDIDDQNYESFESQPKQTNGKRNAIILVVVCAIAVVLGIGLYFMINYFSNNDFKGFSNIFTSESLSDSEYEFTDLEI